MKGYIILKKFLLLILVILLNNIILTIPFTLGYISATNDINSIIRIILEVIVLILVDVKSYLQRKVVNWDK